MAKRTIIGAFPIGDSGEEIVTMEWYPDPEVLSAEIMQMADDFENWAEPMAETIGILVEDTKRHFVEEREPIGAHWVPLDPDYANVKDREYPGGKILHRTGALEEAATSESAWFIMEDSIWFNVAALPSYGPVHQEGSGKGVTAFHRIMRNINPETGELFGKPLTPEQGKFITKHQTPEGRGRNIPARPFIGASIQAIAAIEQAFVNYMDQTITNEWAGAGGGLPITEMGSNVLGTFPIIGHTSRGVPILRTPRGPRFGRRP